MTEGTDFIPGPRADLGLCAPMSRWVVQFPGYTIGSHATEAEARKTAALLDDRGNRGRVVKVTL